MNWRILLEDLQDIYEGKALAPQGTSYRQWVNAIKAYPLNNPHEKDYWANSLEAMKSHNRFRQLITTGNTHKTDLELGSRQTYQLLYDTGKAYNTEINAILLTAFGYALRKATGNRVNYITFEGHGREATDSAIDVNKTLGWWLPPCTRLGLTYKKILEQTLLGYWLRSLEYRQYN